MCLYRRNRLVVRTPRRDRGKPGSNPGYGHRFFLLFSRSKFKYMKIIFIFRFFSLTYSLNTVM